jgi:hypothetical protein
MVATVAGLAVIGWLCANRSDDVLAALASVPLWAFGAAVALHVVTLVLRSEAWGLALASIERPLPRGWVHGANAAAFVAGAAQSQAALPTRVALLRRLAGARAPRPAQICMADVPIFALEVCATAALLLSAALAGLVPVWVAPAAFALGLAVLLAARHAPDRLAHRPMVRGLAVLADRRRRGRLVAAVAALCGLTVTRVWLVLLVCGLPHDLGHVATVFAALGVFGLLPFGPGAPAGATLAAVGTAGVGTAVGAGLMLGATSIAAVFLYALAVGAATLTDGHIGAVRLRARPRSDRPEPRLAAVQLERAEA